MNNKSRKKMNPCLLSPILFLSNSVIASYNNYNLYSYLFFQLMLTSFYYHSTYNQLSNILDKLSIVTVVSYGGYLFVQKLAYIETFYQAFLTVQIIGTFLMTNYLYLYGRYKQKYCFCNDHYKANLYHAFLHLLSSVGHIMIVLL